MVSETIQIYSASDTAFARNVLRKKIAEHGWMPAFMARGSAALTGMVELLLFVQSHGAIDVTIIDHDQHIGIELGCDFCWPDSRYVWLDEARSRLSRVADELEIVDNAEGPRIVVRVWSSGCTGKE